MAMGASVWSVCLCLAACLCSCVPDADGDIRDEHAVLIALVAAGVLVCARARIRADPLRARNEALAAHCRLALSIDENAADPCNPRFTLTMLHAGAPDTPAIEIEMLGFFPAAGNLAVWRDSVRL